MTETDRSGYTVKETLSRQQDAVIYRAVSDIDAQAVLLKVLGSRHGPRDVLRLKREHEVGRPLASTAILRPIALATIEGMPALVFEDSGGLPLDRSIGTPMNVARFLELATHIVEAVAALHRARAVHKDLKPEHIYVHPTTGEVKLTGLGLASQLPRELTAVQPPLLIEGSLPYLSPEQTGHVARAIDSRSDLYSLGVIFYQMLAGRLPFEASDALEWIYCHVARVPPSLLTLVPTLPPPLAAMIEKLLAKMPEGRYQTARGLLHDLQHCLSEWRRDGGIATFVLGERDVADELRVPERLYGREREINDLLAAFERVVSSGAAELILVTGHPGVGKSALVAELRQPVLRERALLLSGKFDQHARAIPYSTLVQVFTRIVLDLLDQDEEDRRAWRERLTKVLGLETQLIVDVIPPLRLLLGDPPPLIEAPLLDAELRFRRVFLAFLGVFAHSDHPLVLFLDDLQWADTASLRLLEEIVGDSDTRHLLLVAAYRDSEVDPLHPLPQMLERIRRARTPVSEVLLAPLGVEEVLALVADTVHADRERARPFAAIVCAKTAGSPFFVLQFLNLLYQDGLLWLDESLTWRWDIARIEARGYTDNVVDFMVQRLTSLSPATQSALTVAACIGNECETSILALVYGKTEQDIYLDLRQALEAGLVLQTRGRIAFAHDRVQQAAYSLLDPDRRTRTHLQVGRLLVEHTSAEGLHDRLFDIVSQLDFGLSLINDEAERLRIAELNLRAGRKAMAASAYELGARYLGVGQGLLPAEAWQEHYELAFGLQIERARCEALSQRLEVALKLIAELTRRARTAAHQLEVTALQIDLVVLQPRAVEENLLSVLAACRRGLDVELTLHPSEDELRQYTVDTLDALGQRSIEDIARLPEMTDVVVKAGVELLSKAMPLAYHVDLGLHDLMSATVVRLSLRHGNSDISPHGYSTFGGALGRLFERWDEAHRFGQVATDVADQRASTPSPGRGSSYFTTAVFINGWTRPPRQVIPLLRRAFEAARECGDINVASFASLVIVEYSFSAGDTLAEVAIEAERQLEYTRQARQYIQNYVESMLLLVRRLRGQVAPPLVIDDASDAAPAKPEPEHPWLRFQHQSCRAIAYFILGDYKSAAAVADTYQTLAHMGSAADVALAWYIAALAYSCHFDEASADERALLRQRLADLEQHHRVWERRSVETFRNRRALISAEAARIDGRDGEAMQLYEEAITRAREDGFVHNEAIAAELAARFCRMRKLRTVADAYLQRARTCYRRWGAEAKVDQLDRLHGSLRPSEPPDPAATLAMRSEELDLLSVLKASQSISSEIELDKLVRTLLETVLVQSGAQRAVLVFTFDNVLVVEAQAAVEASGVSTSLLHQELSEASSLVPVSLLRDVELNRERVIIEDGSAISPVADDYLARTRPRSALCLPILKQGKVLGLLYLENRLLAGVFTPGRLAAVEVLATQSAISVENAWLLAAERKARAAAEAAEHRAALLSEASARLSESLDYSAQLTWLSRFCVRSLADWCILDIVDGSRIARAAVAHREQSKEPFLLALQQAYPPTSDSPHPAARVLRTGEPLLMENISDSELRRSCVDDEHAQLIAALGSRSGVFVPLAARGQVLGALSLISATPGHFGRAALELAQDLAQRVAAAVDNTRLYRASQEEVRLRKQVEAQLVQAQKMESIGRLAGGIAHDFNNFLTVISLGLELSAAKLEEDHPIRKHLANVFDAASSAAALTRQLLTFSRKQIIAPHALDLNGVIDRLEKMIPRLLGEDIKLETVCAPDLASISFDPGQVEQIIVNLAVNARDAMPNGGRLTLQTSNVYFDEDYCRLHVDAQPGAYVLLQVSDSGAGMTDDVLAHIFEPFFTTKESGKGTGLGLAIVYGAIRQNGGRIEVYSEIGVGTTFRLYLPTAAGDARTTPPARASESPPAREASILLVEDDKSVRVFATSVLTQFGHSVHAFPNGEEALAALGSLSPAPELMITDVIMPGMNGRVLSEHVAERLPNIRVLFVSGYPDNVIVHHGILKEGIEFLAKPYSVAQLNRRVHEVLGSAPARS